MAKSESNSIAPEDSLEIADPKLIKYLKAWQDDFYLANVRMPNQAELGKAFREYEEKKSLE